MKILMLLSNGFDPDIRVKKEAESLSNLGHSVSIWCWDRSLSYLSQPDANVSNFFIRRFFFKSAYGSGFRQIGPLLKFYVSVWKMAHKGEFDAIHAHDFDTLFLGWLLKRKLRCRLVYDQHDLFDLYFYNRGGIGRFIASVITKVESKLLRKVDSHIVVTENMKRMPRMKNSVGRIYVINNAPLTNAFEGIVKKASDVLRISYIGSVNYYESIGQACSVIAEFPKEYVFYIHGRGLDVDLLRNEYGQFPNIRIMGEFSYNDLPSLYENSDIAFAFYPTKIGTLSMPNKFFESMITCTPMIVNKDSEFGKIVVNNNWGFGFSEVNFKESLMKFLQTLLLSRAQLDEIKIKMRSARSTYSWEANEKILSGIYCL